MRRLRCAFSVAPVTRPSRSVLSELTMLLRSPSGMREQSAELCRHHRNIDATVASRAAAAGAVGIARIGSLGHRGASQGRAKCQEYGGGGEHQAHSKISMWGITLQAIYRTGLWRVPDGAFVAEMSSRTRKTLENRDSAKAAQHVTDQVGQFIDIQGLAQGTDFPRFQGIAAGQFGGMSRSSSRLSGRDRALPPCRPAGCPSMRGMRMSESRSWIPCSFSSTSSASTPSPASITPIFRSRRFSAIRARSAASSSVTRTCGVMGPHCRSWRCVSQYDPNLLRHNAPDTGHIRVCRPAGPQTAAG